MIATRSESCSIILTNYAVRCSIPHTKRDLRTTLDIIFHVNAIVVARSYVLKFVTLEVFCWFLHNYFSFLLKPWHVSLNRNQNIVSWLESRGKKNTLQSLMWGASPSKGFNLLFTQHVQLQQFLISLKNKESIFWMKKIVASYKHNSMVPSVETGN